MTVYINIYLFIIFAILKSWDFEDMRELRSVTAVPPRVNVEVSFFIFYYKYKSGEYTSQCSLHK